MASRKTFQISVNDSVLQTKYAYNASVRWIEAFVSELATKEGSVFRLIDSYSERQRKDSVRGHRTWSSENGTVIRFDIERVG